MPIPDNIRAVLDDLANGASLERACKPAGRPSKATVLRRIKTDPELALAHAEALDARGEHRVGQLVELNEKLIRGEIDPQTCRVASENLRWLAGKDSNRYSERQRIEATGKDGAPLIPEPRPADMMDTARFFALALYQSGVRSLKELEPAALLGFST
jgi:hypothetical protein